MNCTKWLILAALVVSWGGFLTVSRGAADARPGDGPANAIAALSAIHASDEAMALAKVIILVCSNGGACAR